MNITKELFERFCPVALTPDDRIFNSVCDFLTFSETEVAKYVGKELMEKISALDCEVSVLSPMDDMDDLCCEICRFVCVTAFLEAIPQLDLVLTETGFGVVSNANLAPASSDRIERLKASLVRARDNAVDEVLSKARSIDGWSETENAKQWINSLFWKGEHGKIIGLKYPTRSDLEGKAAELSAAEAELKLLVSDEFHDALCANERLHQGNAVLSQCAMLARNLIAAIVLNLGSISAHKRVLLGFLDKHPTECSKYVESSAYRANHFQPYENKKDDSCFFFG